MKKLSIIKIGGNVIDDSDALNSFLRGFSAIEGPKVLVHGGGKVATELGSRLGIQVRMLEGRRVTDEETLKVVTMVYAGLVGKNIVATLQALGCNSIGLTGADGNSIPAVKREVKDIDYGFVGDVQGDSINASLIDNFLKQGLTPVFCAITHDRNGSLLNTNADTIAAELSIALSAYYDVSLVYCFEKTGVLRDVNDESSLITSISGATFTELKISGSISKGMIPKLDNAFHALRNGAGSVKIGHAGRLTNILNGETHAATDIIH